MAIVIPEMTPQQQAEAVISTESREHERPHKAGDRVFLISANWFADWCSYTGYAYDPQQRKLLGKPSEEHDNSIPRPGPIDCSDLVDMSAAAGDLSAEELAAAVPLRAGLKEKEDFWILHEATWQLLNSWYGAVGPEISRHYIAVGIQRRLEVHHDQWHMKACDEHSGRSTMVPALRMSTVMGLKDACCQALDVDQGEVEIAAYPGMTGQPQSLEDRTMKTLIGVQLQDHQAVILRRKDHPEVAAAAASKRMALMKNPTSSMPLPAPGPVSAAIPMSVEETTTPTAANAPTNLPFAPDPVLTLPSLSPVPLGGGSLSPQVKLGGSFNSLSSSPLSRSFSKPPVWAEDAIVGVSSRRPGLAGLGNLGNTCFMNSSLQCLLHTMPFMRTFLTGAYRADLNRDNPLGLGGKLAVAFGGLMTKIWRGGVGHVSPKHFKWQLGKFAPQFGGYAQQDSQELLAFLLDGLHEDLNRIMVKPYREEKDADGRPDAEVAAEAWDNYRARNDSVVVDHFQGLLKSTLRCPNCDRSSVKFDPFMYLSLPLPTPRTRILTITVVDAAGAAAPLQVSIEVPKSGTVADALAKVAAIFGDSGDDVPERWILAQWSPTYVSNKLELYRDPKTTVASIQERRTTSLFSSKSAALVVYRYPDAASGPGSGLRPIVVFHKARHSLAGVPAVFFVATNVTAAPVPAGDAKNIETPPTAAAAAAEGEAEALPELSFEKRGRFGGNWVLSSPSPIDAPLLDFLRPFVLPDVDARVLLLGQEMAPPLPEQLPVSAPTEGNAENILETRGNGFDEAIPMQDSNMGTTGASPGTTTTTAAGTDIGTGVSGLGSQDGMEVDDDVIGTGTGNGTIGGTGIGLVSHPVATESNGSPEEDEWPLKQQQQQLEQQGALGAVPLAVGGGGGAANGGDEVLLEEEEDTSSMPDLDPFFSAKESMPALEPEYQENTAIGMAVDDDSQLPILEPTLTTTTTTGEGVVLAEGAAVGEAPVQLPAAKPGIDLLLSQSSSTPRSVIGSSPALGSHASVDPLFLTAEWTEDAAAALDLTPWTTPAQHESAAAATAAANAPPRPVTLDDCVDAFLQPERLDQADSWYCTGCKSHVQAEKKLDLWRLPEVLVVHLKRFSYSRYSRDKLDTEVDFPLEGLDLRSVVPVEQGGFRKASVSSSASTPAAATAGAADSNNSTSPPAPVYDLYAVSNHYGGLGGGHYTAYCRMPDDGHWYTFDDSSVVEINEGGVRSPAAYVLFYRRRGSEEKDVEEVISAAVTGGEGSGSGADGGGSALDVDMATGGFGPASLGKSLSRLSGPMLEQVSEEIEAENGSGSGGGGGGDENAALDEDKELGQPSLAAHALPLNDDDEIDMEDI